MRQGAYGPRPFFLVRHGQSDWNVRELTQGQSTLPRLTDLGRQQMQSAGALIEGNLASSDHAPVLVWMSDLTRAVESAEILAERLHGELRSDERLREQHLGELEGRSYAETWTAAAEHDWSDLDLPVAGGESPRQVRARMAAVIDEVEPDVVTVLVSHGDAIRAALAHLAGVASNEAPWVEVPNGAVARVDGRQVSWLGTSTFSEARVRSMTVSTRARRDRCPGVNRPWLAEDGALVRLRLVGGRITAEQMSALAAVSATYGDGNVHLTGRANLQVRGLPHDGERLVSQVHDAFLGTGLVPSEAHDLVRNLMVSPLSGRRGGRADLRPVAGDLDSLIRADARLAELPGRFLFVLDDGRGDLHDQSTDLGLVALDDETAQLRIGEQYGEVVPLALAAEALVTLSHRFLDVRGSGPTAAWHVRELAEQLAATREPEAQSLVTSPPLQYDDEHVPAPDGVVDQALAARLVAHRGELVVTPWHGVLVSERSPR